jgi:hypothetical protein
VTPRKAIRASHTCLAPVGICCGSLKVSFVHKNCYFRKRLRRASEVARPYPVRLGVSMKWFMYATGIRLTLWSQMMKNAGV